MTDDLGNNELSHDELSHEASSLVRAGRSALRPSAADKARVRQTLEQQLSVPGASRPFTEGATSDAGSALLPKLGVGVVGLATLVTAAVLLWPEAPVAPTHTSAPTSSPVIAPQLPEHTETAPPPTATPSPSLPAPAETEAVSPTPAPSGHTGKRPPSSDRLREEVALMTRAQKEFQAQRLKSALALVDEHQRKFPSGALVQERVTLRARVLCAMGTGECGKDPGSR